MKIDFAVAVPDRASGEDVAAAVSARGYAADLNEDSSGDAWTRYCSKVMLATYESVTEAQAELDALSRPFGGCANGWGTLGNVE
jgi:hypothetical protein